VDHLHEADIEPVAHGERGGLACLRRKPLEHWTRTIEQRQSGEHGIAEHQVFRSEHVAARIGIEPQVTERRQRVGEARHRRRREIRRLGDLAVGQRARRARERLQDLQPARQRFHELPVVLRHGRLGFPIVSAQRKDIPQISVAGNMAKAAKSTGIKKRHARRASPEC